MTLPAGANPESGTEFRVLPDYQGGSLVNLMASITAACGGPNRGYPELRLLPARELAAARNIVLLVIDGFGYNHLTSSGVKGALARNLVGSITSVFPSTTATAITTFHTGVAPQQHGLTGWFTHLREQGGVTAVLPFRARGAAQGLSQQGLAPESVFTVPSLFDTLQVRPVIVTHKSIVDSDYNRFHSGRAERRSYDTLKHCFREIEAAVKSGPERKYVYAYYPELDSLAHRFGVASPQVADLCARLDQAFDELLSELAGTDTVVILTADHGFVDVPGNGWMELEQHPELAAMLALPLCGEPRVAYCYVHPERRRSFEAYAAERLWDWAGLWPSEALLARGWFGLGEPHPRLKERAGDYTLLMKDHRAIKDWVPGEKKFAHIGVHGGATPDEMRVPLVVARV